MHTNRHKPVLMVLLALFPACAPTPDEGPPEAADSDPTTTEVRSAVVAPDVVFSLAENTTGWSGSTNTISASSTRQQGSASVNSVGSGTDRFRHNGLGPVDVRSMQYLTFWYFIDDASKIRTDRDSQVEISSSSSIDTEEMHWNLHGQRLYNGWNFVRFQLPGKLRSLTSTSINLAAVKRFRLYHYVTASVTTRIDDIRFTNRVDNPVGSSCVSAAANATIQNVGSTRSGASYGSSGCDRSYVVDVRAYAPASSTGTIVAYAGPNTTDAAACASTRVSAFVYRKHPGTGQYEALPDRRGSFGTSALGRMVYPGGINQICQRPYLNLDLEYPNFLPGADYRVAIRSERVASGVREFGITTLATPQPPSTPSSAAALARKLASNNTALTAAVLKARSIATTSPEFARIGCRMAQLNYVLMDRAGVGAALTSLGASATTVGNGYLPALRRMTDELCRARFDTAFDTALRAVATWHTDILNQIAAHLGVDADVAAGIAERLLSGLVDETVNQCAPYTSSLAAHIFGPVSEGTSIQSIEDNFFVACSPGGAAASSSAKAQEIANALASGQGNGFRQCMNNVLEKELTDTCTDPRAAIETPLPSEVIDKCMELKTPQAQDQCITDAQKRQQERDRAAEQEAEDEAEPDEPTDGYKSCDGLQGIELVICEGAQQALDRAAQPSAEDIQRTRGITDVANTPFFWDAVLEVIQKVTVEFFPFFLDAPWTLAMDGGTAALEGLTKIQEAELRKNCAILPTHDKCDGLEKLGGNNKRCVGETMGERAISYPTNDGELGGSRATSVFDSMNACWCQHIGIPVFDTTCMTAEERQREDCLRNPLGPDDGPRPECVKFLQDSSGLDQSSLVAGMCQYVRPNCDSNRFIDVNGKCGCWRPNVDPNPALRCPNANAVNCGPDSVFDQRSCGCQPLGSGENPWGGNPLCGDDPRFSPGGRDGFITKIPNDLLTNRFYNFEGLPTADFHMVRAGGYVPVVSPALYTRAFQSLGTRLDVTIKMPDAVGGSGYRGAVQAYCTSANVTNRFLGQQELQGLALGRMHTLGFSLTPQDIELCTAGDKAWRLEFAVNSDRQTAFRLGLGSIRFAGNPVSVRAPLLMCPVAAGATADPPPPISLPPGIFVDRIANPTTWTLSNGDVLRELLAGR